MDFLNESARHFGVVLNDLQTQKFAFLQRLLIEWNEKINLTAIKDGQAIVIRHFLDSLSLAPYLGTAQGKHLIDIGSGAGFPGLPLKIVFPDLILTLVESVQKKADFLEMVVKQLEIRTCKVVCRRAEEIGQSADHREKYDFAAARAVAGLSTLVEYILPLLRIGGVALAPKGKAAHQETQQGMKAIRVLGGELRKVAPVEVPGLAEERYLVIIDKIAATPIKYPRRVGIPAKRPL